MHWLTRIWWDFLLEGGFQWRRFYCRLRGHPYPVVWFNPTGMEPDMTCSNCGDYLGY